MTTNATATALQALFDYLGDEDRDDLGSLIVDTCEGAEVFNPRTRELLQKLFNSMPDPDDLTIERIAEEINKVGSEFAINTALDILYHADH